MILLFLIGLDVLPKKQTKEYLLCEVGYSIEFIEVFDEVKNEMKSKVICINEKGSIIDPVKVSVE